MKTSSGSEAHAKGRMAATVEWNGNTVIISDWGAGVIIRKSYGQVIATADLSAFDYVTEVHPAIFCGMAPDDEWLAVLVKLRATSHRSMLLIYNSLGKLAYQEYLERDYYPEELRVADDREGKPVLIAGRNKVIAWLCQW